MAKTKTLNQLAADIARDQAALDSAGEGTRARVIRIGRELRQAQKMQKREQSETGQTWKEWCEEEKGRRATFPSVTQTKCYLLIARHPRAYKVGMSIKEAYKEAGEWKKNGGNPPLKQKTVIKNRPLITIQANSHRLHRKIESLTDLDIAAAAEEQAWTNDEISGALDEVTLLRQDCNLLIRKLKELQDANAASH